jgi:uncharacterized membrane protein YgcG
VEGDIPDVTAKHILGSMKDQLRASDWYGAYNTLLTGIEQQIDPVAKEQLALAAAEQEKKNQEAWDTFLTVLMWIGFIGIGITGIWWIFFRPGYLKRKAERRRVDEINRIDTMRYMSRNLASDYRGRGTASTKKDNDDYTSPPYIPDNSYRSNDNDSYRSNDNNDGGGFGGSDSFSGGGASDSY